MPYVVRIDRSGKVVEVDKFYTSRWKKKKARKGAGAGTNPGECKKN